MNWSKLKQNKCPKCEKELSFRPGRDIFTCLECGFQIRKEKFEEIVKNVVGKRFVRPVRELNINEDFHEDTRSANDFDPVDL